MRIMSGGGFFFFLKLCLNTELNVTRVKTPEPEMTEAKIIVFGSRRRSGSSKVSRRHGKAVFFFFFFLSSLSVYRHSKHGLPL